MKLYYYDVFEGDKGIIVAKDKKSAEVIFNHNYESINPSCSNHDWKNGGAYLREIGTIPCTDPDITRIFIIEEH